jgi:hypothetical protein
MIPILPSGISSEVDKIFFNLLGLTPKVFWGVIVGPLLIAVLFIVPYIDPNPSRRYKDRKIMIAIGAIFAAVIIYLSLAGIPTGVPITGFGYVGGDPAPEVGQEFIPDEGVGPVRALPYSDYVAGSWPVSAQPGTGNAEFDKLIREIHDDMERRKVNPDPHGKLLSSDANASVDVKQVQPNLINVLLSINYTDEKGVATQFNKDTYLHADSGYAGE